MSPGKRVIVGVLLVVSCLIAYTSRPITATAATGINSQISFTGKMVKADNTNIVDGTYNVEFKVYQDGTSAGVGSTLMWTEDYLVAGSTGMPSTGGVTFSSGTFSVNLGSICILAGSTCGAKTNTGISFNQDTLWLSVQIGNSTSCTVTSGVTSFNTACGGDGEMSPYIRLTAVPYALNANLLSGIAVTALGQLASNQTWTGTNTFQPTTNISSLLIKQTSVGSPTADIFNVQTANATTLMQFTGPSANASNIVLQSAGASSTISVGANAIANTIQIGDATTVNTGNTQAIGIGNLTVAGTTNVTIGSFTGATAGSTTVQAFGTLALQTATGGTVNISANGLASTVQLGNTTGAVAQTINIGNNATASSTSAIVIGNLLTTSTTTLQGGTNSTGGIILQAGGTATTGRVQIGVGGAGSTTPDYLALDIKSTTSETGGQEGDIYYNTFDNKFRCFQGAAWTDCIGAGGGGSTLQGAYDSSTSPATITTSAGDATKGVRIAAGVAPTADILTVTNAGFGVTGAGISALQINYVGGAAAVEASGVRIDFTPGGTTGGTWSGLRIVANATGAVTGVTGYGLKLEGPTSPGAGTETGVYAGTGWDIGLDIRSGGIQLAATADPTVPTAGNLKIYAKSVSGRVVPKWLAPSGVDTSFQASFGFNRIAMVTPSGTGTTVPQVWGTTVTSVGTLSHPALATTNILTSSRRFLLTSAATAGSLLSQRQATTMAWRGNAAGLGGFFFATRFNLTTLAAGNRAFVGLADVVTAPTNVDPTTSTTPGKIGLAINANTGNWNWVNNVTGSAPTIAALGANFPVNVTDLYELVIYSPPNGSSITYRVTNLSTAAQTADTAVSTNIPTNTTFLAPLFWMTNNATASAIAMGTTGWYLESDQ